MGDGEIGVRGMEGLRESEGLEAALMLRESFGLTARVASISTIFFCIWKTLRWNEEMKYVKQVVTS